MPNSPIRMSRRALVTSPPGSPSKSSSSSNNNNNKGGRLIVKNTTDKAMSSSSSQDQPDSNNQNQNHQRRLEEASAVCARGRQYWTRDGNATKAVAEFEHALQLLETLLGTYHSLTAKTYYWLGFIRKHNAETYPQALQAFVQTARIRLVLLGPSHESTQEAIAAIRWVLLHQQKSAASSASPSASSSSSSNADSIKQYLSNLYESIRLETLGDARLRHREYSQAIDYYQEAMTIFPDPTHATIMGKRAFCCFKLNELDRAMYWYRQALLVFTTQTVHHREAHPDVPTTLERMQQVLQTYKHAGANAAGSGSSYSAESVQLYCTSVVLKSVQEQYLGQTALDQGRVSQAQQHFEAALELESNLLGSHHGIVRDTLQPLVDLTKRLVKDTHLEKTIADLQMQKKLLEQQLEGIQKVVNNNDDRYSDELDTTAAAAAASAVSSPTGAASVSSPSSLSSSVAAATPSVAQLQAKIDRLQKENDDTTIANIQLEERLKNVEKERLEWQTKSEDAKLSLLEFQQQASALLDQQQQSNRLQGEKALEEERKLRVQAEDSLAKAQLQQARDAQEQHTSIRLLQDKLSERDGRLKELEQLIQSQERNLQEYQVKIQSHSEKVEAWQSKVESLEKETSALRSVAAKSPSKDHVASNSATKDLEARLQLAAERMASLKQEKALTQHNLEVSLETQQSLSKELTDSAATIKVLQGQIIKLEMSQSALQEQLSSQGASEDALETPAGSPARSKTPGASPGGLSTTSTINQIDSDPQSTVLKARRLEAQLQHLSQEMHSTETDDAIARNKLASQNERAVKTIQALSKELIGMEEKYRKLTTKHEKLRLLFAKLEAKNRALKEQNVQIIMAARSQPPPSKVGAQESSSSSSSIAISDSLSPRLLKEWPLPSTGLLKSVRLSRSSYKSTIADYFMRRPFLRDDAELTDEERRYFSETPICASLDDYASHAHVEDPATIELVALVGFDHSRLYLVSARDGNTKIAHRRMDGTWRDLGILDSTRQSDPLGWVSFHSSDKKGRDDTLYYSLDEIVEEAQIYRQHYCQAVSLNASSGRGHNLETKLLRWLAVRTKSPYLESVAYTYGSKSFAQRATLLERPGVMLLLLTLLVALLAVVAARYIVAG